MDPHCRLHRVRFKSGGEIRPLPTPPAAPADVSAGIKESAESAIADFGPKLAGYALVVWCRDASERVSYWNGNGSSLTTNQIPTYVRDALTASISRRS